jgi:hypothetical protein
LLLTLRNQIERGGKLDRISQILAERPIVLVSEPKPAFKTGQGQQISRLLQFSAADDFATSITYDLSNGNQPVRKFLGNSDMVTLP